MKISTIYPTYQGEVNIFGIGAPVIFVRTSGCHLRCYKETLGLLCDTPNELDGTVGTDMSVEEIADSVRKISEDNGGIDLICFTGGDPLWRNQDEIHNLFAELSDFHISVETSGTLSIREFANYEHVSFVLDYKLSSAGVKQKFITKDLSVLSKNDIIKFVIYDQEDYSMFLELFKGLYESTLAKICVGTYWGGTKYMKSSTLIDMLKADRLLGKVHINMQAHKLLTMYDTLEESAFSAIKIPEKL